MTGETHYVPAFTEVNGHSQRAACGVFVRAGAHTNEPTCPTCQEWLGVRERDDDPFAVDPEFHRPVKSKDFDPCADYTERRR